MFNLSMMPWIWLGLTVILIVIECLTSGLTTIWFAAGSFLMIFAAIIKCPLWLQIVLFAVISMLLLIFARPILKKKLSSKKIRMNSDAIIGEKAVVTQAVSEMQKGAIKINGLEWTAATEENQTFNAGDICTVKEIKGATAFIVPFKK